jgi:3-phenylpropionate/cinnamic acid dioxygenase small subunit
MTTTPSVDIDLLRQVEQFLFLEARLADEGDYDDWEALWTDDGVYWIPANGDDIDPATQMSILFDNRSRIALRVRQLKSDKRHAQNPRSRLRRLLANIELLDVGAGEADGDGDIVAGANFLIYESRPRGTTMWGGRTEYRLRRLDGGWRMARKKVMLVDNDRPLSTLAFLV